MGRGGIKESSGGVNSNVMYLIYCKNFYKCHSVPPPSTTMKKKKESEPKNFNPQFHKRGFFSRQDKEVIKKL
jgi:hypothetical protein